MSKWNKTKRDRSKTPYSKKNIDMESLFDLENIVSGNNLELDKRFRFQFDDGNVIDATIDNIDYLREHIVVTDIDYVVDKRETDKQLPSGLHSTINSYSHKPEFIINFLDAENRMPINGDEMSGGKFSRKSKRSSKRKTRRRRKSKRKSKRKSRKTRRHRK